MRQTIKKYADFAVSENDPTFRTEFFVVRARPTKWPNNAQYGVRATKKTLKRAHDRNFAKRRLRALIREYQGMLAGTHDYIFIARAAIIDVEFARLRELMQRALKKLKNNKQPKD